MNQPSAISIVIGVLGLVAAAAMGVALITDEDEDDDGFRATKEGFVIEPASSVGPDAFTPSVEVGGEAVCDTEQFLEELTARPDAVREWARVLGIPESEVAGYVATLKPKVLTEDTPVTNHGLRDGSAYARPSMLEAGTAVMMGELPPTVMPPPEESIPPDTPTTTAATVPTTTTPGEEIPVTRCRCGNPLLPAYAPAGGESVTTTTTTTTLDGQDVPPPEGSPPDDSPPDDSPPDDIPPDDIPPDDIPPDDIPPDDVPPDNDWTPGGEGPPGP